MRREAEDKENEIKVRAFKQTKELQNWFGNQWL